METTKYAGGVSMSVLADLERKIIKLRKGNRTGMVLTVDELEKIRDVLRRRR